MKVANHFENLSLLSRPFKEMLAMRYFEEAGKAAGSQAMQDAIQTICGQARHRGPSCDVYVRLAWHAGKCYLEPWR